MKTSPPQTAHLRTALILIFCLFTALAYLALVFPFGSIFTIFNGADEAPSTGAGELSFKLRHEFHFGFPTHDLKSIQWNTESQSYKKNLYKVPPIVVYRDFTDRDNRVHLQENIYDSSSTSGTSTFFSYVYDFMFPLFDGFWVGEDFRDSIRIKTKPHRYSGSRMQQQFNAQYLNNNMNDQTLINNNLDNEGAFDDAFPDTIDHGDRFSPFLSDAGDDILNPDLEDAQTVLMLAKIANNAYALPGDPSWLPTPEAPYNVNISYGFESNGLRGHVYVSDDEKVVLISTKGTSPSWFGIGGPTGARDRYNDNLMFSCCCGRVDSGWKPVCDCYKGTNPETKNQQCSKFCLIDVSTASQTYYNAARVVYREVRRRYPDARYWFVGHSLGGAISALMSMTVGGTAISFESPGDRMYAKRLGFDVSSNSQNIGLLPIFHIGNTADPIFMGQCRGAFSACNLVKYAMESRCHLGNKCVYDLGSQGLDIRYHQITTLINKLLTNANSVPKCKPAHETEPEFPPPQPTPQPQPVPDPPLPDPAMTLMNDRRHINADDDDGPCLDCTWWEYI